MKPSQKSSAGDHPKSGHAKSSRKSSKSRKVAKLDVAAPLQQPAPAAGATPAALGSPVIASRTNSTTAAPPQNPATPAGDHVFTAPAPPATTSYLPNSVLEETLPGSDAFTTRNPHTKCYVGLEPRSIKIIWEQHDQSDIELSREVCARVAEDASYKLWELISNIKTYARHSGNAITYDLVNEVLRDCDVPPMLGAMDSEWERIDYDGSYFFYSDKIVELREEYQKEVKMKIPVGPDFECHCPINASSVELMKKYIPSLVYIIFNADSRTFDVTLNEAAFSVVIPSCYRIILEKFTSVLAFKQSDAISERCWRFLRACSVNPLIPFESFRHEYVHLSEILICQLLGPLEHIKVHPPAVKEEPADVKPDIAAMDIDGTQLNGGSLDLDDVIEVKPEFPGGDGDLNGVDDNMENIYKLVPDEDAMPDGHPATSEESPVISPYFASPVDVASVNELCSTIGHMAAVSGFFQTECTFHITRRLQRFFEGRNVHTEMEWQFISRAVRGLIALGEYAFREFIPFIYKFQADTLPETIWNEFAVASSFLRGRDDIFLYEWLEYLCGADKLQPFLVYSSRYHQKFMVHRYAKRKVATYRIVPKVVVRRLEWSILAAAMCHGDDPNRALRAKPTMEDFFPDMGKPLVRHRNRPGQIRFKFPGCRPHLVVPKTEPPDSPGFQRTHVKGEIKMEAPEGGRIALLNINHRDILIARRRLFKPLTNEQRFVVGSSLGFVHI